MVQLKCSQTINIAGLNLGCDGVIWVQWMEWPEIGFDPKLRRIISQVADIAAAADQDN